MKYTCLAILCLAVLGLVAAETKTLVLVDDLQTASTHSIFLHQLQARSQRSVDVKLATDRTLRLREWDDWLYDEVVILASKVSEFGGAVDGTALLEFVDEGNNLLIAVDHQVSDELRDLVADLGVDLDAKETVVIDHFHEDELPPHVDHTAILTRQVITSPGVVGRQSLSGEVLYHGIGMSIPPGSVQAFPALSAESTAYSAVPGAVLTDTPALVGNDIVLAALVQTRNNARVAVAGSIDMFSNKYYHALVGVRRTKEFTESANEAFCTTISKWVFHESGVLRVTDLKHHHKAGGPQPASYRINDELVFSLSIEELVDGSWQPYRADDLQVDFVMLDPHVRTTLEHNNTGVFSTNIKVPDVYGVSSL